MKNRLFNLAKLVISLGLLVLLFRLLDWRESWAALKGMNLQYFLVAVSLFQASLVLRSFRWLALLNAVEVDVPVRRLIHLYYVGVFFNTFLPSGFGGDPVKMYELARYSHRGSEAVGTVFVDRLAGIIVLFVMGLLALPLTYRSLPRQEALGLLLTAILGLVAAWTLFRRSLATCVLRLVPGKLRGRLQSLYDAVHKCGSQALWQAMAVSALFNITLFGLNYFIAKALGLDIPFMYFVAFMPVLSLSMLLPSVGALGTREGAYVLLFGAAGVAEPMAMAMSLSFYLINVLTGSIGAALYAVEAVAGLRSRETS